MHPIAFKIFGFTVYFYGVMMVVAYGVVLFVIRYTRKYENMDLDTAIDSTIYAIIGGVIGARLLYVILNLKEYEDSLWHVLNVREGGLSWHGAIIGGYLALYILSRAKKIPYGKISDFIAVHSTLALAIGRIGCFLNGCCYGKECSLPWAVEFKAAGVLGHRHPTQLYECFMLLIAFFVLLRWWKHKKFSGEMTMAMLLSYGIIRFIVEFFRYNTPNQYLFGGPLSLAQYVSILLVTISSIVIYWGRKRALKDTTS